MNLNDKERVTLVTALRTLRGLPHSDGAVMLKGEDMEALAKRIETEQTAEDKIRFTLMSGGNVCPRCGSSDTWDTGRDHESGTWETEIEERACKPCGAVWRVHYVVERSFYGIYLDDKLIPADDEDTAS